MKLTGMFSGDNQITDNAKAQVNTVRSEAVNRQIQALIPGQTIQGELVFRNGNEVQIRVADDLVLQAKLDRNMNLEMGMNLTFQVKNNGKALLLSPLFTNVASDANVLKALDMASLPLNKTTTSMTQQLMEAGLPIDRNTLQQVYREVNLYPEATSSDIVNLHKMKMPVNADNVTQMVSYRNLTHQLVTGLNNVLDAVPEMFSRIMDNGDTEVMVNLYRQLTSLIEEKPSEGLRSPDAKIDFAGQSNGADYIIQEDIQAEEASSRSDFKTTTFIGEFENTIAEIFEGPEGAENKELAGKEELAGKAEVTGRTEIANTNQELYRLLNQPVDAQEQQSILAKISHLWRKNDGKDILAPVLKLLKEQWTITPEEVADPEKVESLYGRLNKQLKSLAQSLENSGQSTTSAYKAVTNLNQNLDFMQQVNQLYTYVQLPLRLQQGDAHGDLYVYTNKKHLAAKDGQISALLHLDMEHLGPVDVYVSMVSEKVNTKFYLQDDEMLDFLMGHMEVLTQRLQNRGFQCSFELLVHNLEEAPNDIRNLLQEEKRVPLAEYAFDVRT